MSHSTRPAAASRAAAISHGEVSRSDKVENSAGCDRLRAVAVAAVSTLAFAGSVTAQEGPAPSSGPALEEVIVTAQKRAESLQDVPTAISAMSGEALTRQNITDVRDLQARVPTLNIGEGYSLTKITMRGLGATSDFINEDPSVVLYVDGAIIARPEIQGLSFFDLERVEVLRGPQGTLYGRNATGGMVNLITAKPTRDFQGYARAGVGNYDALRAELALGGPLTDIVSARVAYQFSERSGYGINEVTGNDIDDDGSQAVRAHLQFDFTPEVKLLLTGDYAHDDDASGQQKFLRETFPGTTNPSRIASGRGGFPAGERNVAADFDPATDRETWSTTGTFDWALSERFALRNILNYREMSQILVQDLDASSVRNWPRTTMAISTSDAEQITQELQLLYDGSLLGNPLNAILGLYYFHEDLVSTQSAARAPRNPPSDPPRLAMFGTGTTEAIAGFWHLEYELTPQWSLRLGGRYTDESREILNSAFVRTAGGAGPQQPVPVDINGKKSFSDYTNDAGIDYQINDDVMLYYTYSEGFKSGAGLLAQTDSPIIDPETVTNHEVGVKSRLFEQRVMLNVSVFSAEIEDLQRQQTLVGEGATGIFTLFNNASELKVDGVELDAEWAVTRDFRLLGSAAYLDARFGDFVTINPLDPTQTPMNVKGNRPDRAPEWKANLSGEFDIVLRNDAVIRVAAGASYTGEQFFNEFNQEDVFQEGAYTLVDASLTFVAPGERWTTQLWGKNLTDELRKTTVNASGLGRVLVRGLIPPRTWGVMVGYRF